MVIFSVGIVPDLEDDGVQRAAAPSNCTILFRVFPLLIDNVQLIEYLLRIFQADPVFPFNLLALPGVELEAHSV